MMLETMTLLPRACQNGMVVETSATLIEEVAARQQRQPVSPRAAFVLAADDERPPERVGRGEQEGDEQAVGEEAGAAVDAEAQRLRRAAVGRSRSDRCSLSPVA